MKVHDNFERLIWHFRENPQPTSVTRVVMAAVMNAREAYDAIQYGIRHGVIERIECPDARPNERVQYRWTGQPMPPNTKKNDTVGPSFDELLMAWGIPRVPPCLPAATSIHTFSSD